MLELGRGALTRQYWERAFFADANNECEGLSLEPDRWAAALSREPVVGQ